MEFGYFTGKANFEAPDCVGKILFHVEFGSTLAACNVTLRHPFGERGFWYGGVGAGIVCVSMTANAGAGDGAMGFGAKLWSFLGQAFAGFGWYLNEIGN